MPNISAKNKPSPIPDKEKSKQHTAELEDALKQVEAKNLELQSLNLLANELAGAFLETEICMAVVKNIQKNKRINTN